MLSDPATMDVKRTDAAREYATRVADDEQFGARAKEILSRLR